MEFTVKNAEMALPNKNNWCESNLQLKTFPWLPLLHTWKLLHKTTAYQALTIPPHCSLNSSHTACFLLLLPLPLQGPYLEWSFLQTSFCLINSHPSSISQLRITFLRNIPDTEWPACPGSLLCALKLLFLTLSSLSPRVWTSFPLVQTLFHRFWESENFQGRER